MPISENLLLAMFVIFALPWAAWRALGGTSILPLVVVQIIVGILLGPGVLGAWSPDIYQSLFRVEVIAGINAVAQWAVILFVFVAGLELDVTDAWNKRRETTLAAGFALVVPLVLGALVAWGMVQSPGWVGDKGQVRREAWCTGYCFALKSQARTSLLRVCWVGFATRRNTLSCAMSNVQVD